MPKEFERALKSYDAALEEFYKGDPDPLRKLYSDEQDIALLGAFGGVSVNHSDVMKHLTTRASFFQGGHNVAITYEVKFCEGDFGYAVGIERFEAKVGGKESKVALRATTIFRREGRKWRVVHRQGDPLVHKIDPSLYRYLAKHNEEMGG